MLFECLRADRVEDRSRWLTLWELPGLKREPWAHPTYMELFEEGDSRSHVLLVGTSGATQMIWPLTVQSHGSARQRSLDATSPFAFGGLVCSDVDAPAQVIQAYWADFRAWANREGLVCVFSRLNVGTPTTLAAGLNVRHVSDYVVRRLDGDEEALWSSYAHKVRKNVKRGRRSGVEVTIDERGDRAEEFVAVYRNTMSRRGAQTLPRLTASRLRQAFDHMPGALVIVIARRGGKTLSAELLGASNDRFYSILGGTYAEAFDIRPNDTLKHEICTWGLQQGKRAYVLGAGRVANDGIQRYKESFAPNSKVPFHVGHAVVDAGAYLEMTAGLEVAPDGTAPDGTFPAYRAG